MFNSMFVFTLNMVDHVVSCSVLTLNMVYHVILWFAVATLSSIIPRLTMVKHGLCHHGHTWLTMSLKAISQSILTMVDHGQICAI